MPHRGAIAYLVLMQRRDLLTAGAALLPLRSLFPGHRLPHSPRGLRLGCASITWGDDDPQAITDIAALGFRGIQLRTSAVRRWGSDSRSLKALLDESHLALVALSSGSLHLDAGGTLEEQLEPHLRHARFTRELGGSFLQVTDERPGGGAPSADSYRSMGRILTELGRRTGDLGVQLALHNHMGALSESPDEVARVLEASDARHVKLLLDVAHYHQAGGRPAEAIRTWRDRLALLHLKDVESPVPGGEADSFRFVELGRGEVDLPAVFDALREIRFDGWGIVELDSVTEPGRTPAQATAISAEYLMREGAWDRNPRKREGAKGD